MNKLLHIGKKFTIVFGDMIIIPEKSRKRGVKYTGYEIQSFWKLIKPFVD